MAYPSPELCTLCRQPAVGTLTWRGETNHRVGYVGKVHRLRLCADHTMRVNLTSPKATWTPDTEVAPHAG